ncbi:MAG: DUF4369 domain-containing protein [Bacteroidaceae bacterium]|nr:DUF4369 domain-containing protein [Bacteroidaceae bacterium]
MKTYILPLIILSALFLSACKEKVSITGETSVPELDGRMLYLKVYNDGDLMDIDSAQVIHGRFHFSYSPDSTLMANLFIGDESLMPVVIDDSPMTISIGDHERRAYGSALNDTLFHFIRRKSAIDEQLAEMPHRESQMIMDGLNHEDIVAQLNAEIDSLTRLEDDMLFSFIKANMDNVLAPGVFMIATSAFPYPVLTPAIEELVALGSESFRNNAYVRDYLRMARENMEKMEP